MKTGDRQFTTNPVRVISGENGEFRVIDEFGNIERYFCADYRIVLIQPEGVDGVHGVPAGQFLVEKVSDVSKLPSDDET